MAEAPSDLRADKRPTRTGSGLRAGDRVVDEGDDAARIGGHDGFRFGFDISPGGRFGIASHDGGQEHLGVELGTLVGGLAGGLFAEAGEGGEGLGEGSSEIHRWRLGRDRREQDEKTGRLYRRSS